MFDSFLVFRFSGVLISTRLKPSTMILTSLTCCILSAILLVFTAESSQESLFFGTGAIGFFVSLQFASGLKLITLFMSSDKVFRIFMAR